MQSHLEDVLDILYPGSHYEFTCHYNALEVEVKLDRSLFKRIPSSYIDLLLSNLADILRLKWSLEHWFTIQGVDPEHTYASRLLRPYSDICTEQDDIIFRFFTDKIVFLAIVLQVTLDESVNKKDHADEVCDSIRINIKKMINSIEPLLRNDEVIIERISKIFDPIIVFNTIVGNQRSIISIKALDETILSNQQSIVSTKILSDHPSLTRNDLKKQEEIKIKKDIIYAKQEEIIDKITRMRMRRQEDIKQRKIRDHCKSRNEYSG